MTKKGVLGKHHPEMNEQRNDEDPHSIQKEDIINF